MHLIPVDLVFVWSTGILALTFAFSGTAKLFSPSETLRSFDEFKLPSVLRNRASAILLPVWELLLAVGLLYSSSLGLIVVAALSCFTLLVFTGLLISVLRRGEAVSCNCFGTVSSDGPVTWWTVLRNAGLLIVAIAILLSGARSERSAVHTFTALDPLPVTLVLLAWSLTVILVLATKLASRRHNRSAAPQSTRHASALHTALTAEMGDPIPDIELVDEHGTPALLARLDRGKPVLLIFLSINCGPCETAAARLADWQNSLGHIRVLVASSSARETLHAQLPATIGRSWYGARGARKALGVQGTPAAVLLGAGHDPILASPVVHGIDEIEHLLASIVQATAPHDHPG